MTTRGADKRVADRRNRRETQVRFGVTLVEPLRPRGLRLNTFLNRCFISDEKDFENELVMYSFVVYDHLFLCGKSRMLILPLRKISHVAVHYLSLETLHLESGHKAIMARSCERERDVTIRSLFNLASSDIPSSITLSHL